MTIANVLDVASSVAATTRDDDDDDVKNDDDDGATPRARTPSSSSAVSVSRGASEDARERDDEESKGETRSIGHPCANLMVPVQRLPCLGLKKE